MSNITTDAEAINTSDPLVWVGFACAILSAFGSCAALMIVRLSTEKEAHLPFCQRRLFFIGAWCNLACEAGLTTVALALSPLSLLSPVSGLTIVFGAVFAWVGLFGNKREKATLIELAALSVTVTGVGISASFGPSGQGIPDLYDTSFRLISWQHIIYATVGWSIAIGWLSVVTFDKRLGRFRPRPDHPITAPLAGTTSGWMASYSLSMLKILMTALRRAFTGDLTPARYPVVWISVVLLIPVASGQIYSLNSVMGAGGTNYVLPWYTVMVIVLSATAGGMIFDEFSTLPQRSLIIFWTGGVLVTMIGLFILAIFQAKRAKLAEEKEKALKEKYGKATPSLSSPAPSAADDKDLENVMTAPEAAPGTSMHPGAPPGYVQDTACFFCGARLACCGKAWW